VTADRVRKYALRWRETSISSCWNPIDALAEQLSQMRLLALSDWEFEIFICICCCKGHH
jgi:hypothetical protein